MKCDKCNTPLAMGAKYCGVCGTDKHEEKRNKSPKIEINKEFLSSLIIKKGPKIEKEPNKKAILITLIGFLIIGLMLGRYFM